jgi:hypothetical protein
MMFLSYDERKPTLFFAPLLFYFFLRQTISELETECEFKVKSKQEWLQNVQHLEDNLNDIEAQISKISSDTVLLKRTFLSG